MEEVCVMRMTVTVRGGDELLVTATGLPTVWVMP